MSKARAAKLRPCPPESDPKTHKGYNLDALTSRELYAKFGLEVSPAYLINPEP
jgi:hypothetical protein